MWPHNRLMQRLPIARYLSGVIIVWGVVLCLNAACTTFASLMVARFMLGALEGAVTAGFVLITARWYQRDEQATRTAFWYIGNAAAQIFGAAFAYGVAVGFDNSAITFAGWKALFILSGGITCVFGTCMWLYFPDSPITAKWLNEADRRVAVERLRVNQQGIGSKVFKWPQFREAFTDPRVSPPFDVCRNTGPADRCLTDVAMLPVLHLLVNSIRRPHRVFCPAPQRVRV